MGSLLFIRNALAAAVAAFYFLAGDRRRFQGLVMTLTTADVCCLSRLRDKLPDLESHDRDHVLAYGVALYAAGITGDGSKERNILENLIIQYGWRIMFCRYVERCIAQCGEPVSYAEWRSTYGK